ncbi:MAG: hypothetical protein J6W33_01385, partial [Spirochaetia bacterium]|nr:hypothetical protein [Spirochaetia bacterium]
AYEQYEDEEGNEYQDQNSNNYIDQQISSTPYSYDLWFTYYTFAEGAFLGPISTVEDIPALLSINDYFVWSGSQTESALSITGEFLPGRLYKFIGTAKEWQWEEDTDIGHNNTAMGDILNVAQADLQKNNSRAYAYLDHLTANQVFADRLVASQAFIEKLSADEGFFNKLFANEITISEDGSIQSENYSEGSSGFKITADGIVNANAGRFAGGLGSSEYEDVSYRDWIPFETGILIISVQTTVQMSGSDVRRYFVPSYIAVISSSSYTTFVGGTRHTYIQVDGLAPMYDNGNIGVTYDEQTISALINVVHYSGYKISSCSYPSQGTSQIRFHILKI